MTVYQIPPAVAMPPPTEQGFKPSTPSQESGEEGQLRIFRLTLRSNRPILGTATGVRGFFGTRFPDEILLHQHIPGTTATLYQYPKVQYRIAGGEVTAIGIAEGAAASAGSTTSSMRSGWGLTPTP